MDSKCALNGESFVLKSMVLKFNLSLFRGIFETVKKTFTNFV